MISFPNAKINIGLNVIGKRKDGYHDLETIFYPIPLYDVIEIIRHVPGSEIPGNSVKISMENTTVYFSVSGLDIDAGLSENICIRACRLLSDDFPDLPDFHLLLHKNIPTGAGLGGGSADAAFTLRLIQETFNLDLSASQLESYAFQLGSDAPFFVRNTPVFAQKRGEEMESINLDLSQHSLVLVFPQIHIRTKEAFNNIIPRASSSLRKKIMNTKIADWKSAVENDFELPIFQLNPEVALIKEELYRKGALYASMSGSGSALYGIYPQGAKPSFSFPPEYTLWHFPTI